MKTYRHLNHEQGRRHGQAIRRFSAAAYLHIDGILLFCIALLLGIGFLTLYSASMNNVMMLKRQLGRVLVAVCLMLVAAQIPPRYYKLMASKLFGLGLVLLLTVLIIGISGKGAQRWLNLGFVQFQPSELMKLAVPMMLASYFSEQRLPPFIRPLLLAALWIMLPALLIALQPDLGTALLIASSGFFVLFLAGMPWRLIAYLMLIGILIAPIGWFVMHDYQRQRVLTFLNPENDPLGAGYHIIQSKIAIGSGGVYGKGWLHGTQSHLQFLPERTTDFIFSVFGEEFGLMGSFFLLLIYFIVIARGLHISMQAQDTFTRLLSGSLILTFSVYIFVNIGMVSGLLPVVGIPLPLISYGGTSMVTLLTGFGILMSIHTHRKLLSN